MNRLEYFNRLLADKVDWEEDDWPYLISVLSGVISNRDINTIEIDANNSALPNYRQIISILTSIKYLFTFVGKDIREIDEVIATIDSTTPNEIINIVSRLLGGSNLINRGEWTVYTGIWNNKGIWNNSAIYKNHP